MIWHQVDFNKLVSDVSFFRKTIQLKLLRSLVKPLTTLSNTTLYQMQHDSRVIYLEKVLNEYLEVEDYNPINHLATRRVIIEDGTFNGPLYIYQTSENKPVYLGTKYLDRDTGNTYQFVIKIPSDISFDEARLRAVVDFYKLAGKQYSIEIY
ncbi:MAG: hypothetical protein JST78_09515 [Bacteroidetes bacterium]|nr:hypothetical protein [Bacteroidota bacterium]